MDMLLGKPSHSDLSLIHHSNSLFSARPHCSKFFLICKRCVQGCVYDGVCDCVCVLCVDICVGIEDCVLGSVFAGA